MTSRLLCLIFCSVLSLVLCDSLYSTFCSLSVSHPKNKGAPVSTKVMICFGNNKPNVCCISLHVCCISHRNLCMSPHISFFSQSVPDFSPGVCGVCFISCWHMTSYLLFLISHNMFTNSHLVYVVFVSIPVGILTFSLYQFSVAGLKQYP